MQSENSFSASFFITETLSETDFLSVTILDSCIEMPQLHKLALPASDMDFLYFLSISC